MKFNPLIKVFGDVSYRGESPSEASEQATFLNRLRVQYPALFAIAVHIKNEGKRSMSQVSKDKAQGLKKGAPDIMIPCSPPILIELKQKNHTKSRWQTGQQEFLIAAQEQGAFVCVAIGADGAMLAIQYYLDNKKAPD